MNDDIRNVLIDSPEAAHKSYRYLADSIKPTGLTDFLEVTIDITAGIETCLDLISSSEIARGCDDVPILNPSDSGNLLRLAMAASRLLRNEGLQHVEWLNENAQRKGSGS